MASGMTYEECIEHLRSKLDSSVLQTVYGISLNARSAAKLVERDPQLARENIDAIVVMCEQVLRDVRQIIESKPPR